MQTEADRQQLHARALEILRSMTVAADDEPSQLARDLGADDLARIDSCVAFTKASMDQVNCAN